MTFEFPEEMVKKVRELYGDDDRIMELLEGGSGRLPQYIESVGTIRASRVVELLEGNQKDLLLKEARIEGEKCKLYYELSRFVSKELKKAR